MKVKAAKFLSVWLWAKAEAAKELKITGFANAAKGSPLHELATKKMLAAKADPAQRNKIVTAAVEKATDGLPAAERKKILADALAAI